MCEQDSECVNDLTFINGLYGCNVNELIIEFLLSFFKIES